MLRFAVWAAGGAGGRRSSGWFPAVRDGEARGDLELLVLSLDTVDQARDLLRLDLAGGGYGPLEDAGGQLTHWQVRTRWLAWRADGMAGPAGQLGRRPVASRSRIRPLAGSAPPHDGLARPRGPSPPQDPNLPGRGHAGRPLPRAGRDCAAQAADGPLGRGPLVADPLR